MYHDDIAALLQCTSPKHPCDMVAILYMITDITAGYREIDALQKLGLSDKTCCTVIRIAIIYCMF